MQPAWGMGFFSFHHQLFFLLLRWAQSMNECLGTSRLIAALDDMRNCLRHHCDAVNNWADAQAQVAA
jgi:hypothetical protein